MASDRKWEWGAVVEKLMKTYFPFVCHIVSFIPFSNTNSVDIFNTKHVPALGCRYMR